MAVKDDMDICLNIVGGTVNSSKKQSSPIVTDAHIKRLKRGTGEVARKSFQKNQSSEPSKGLVVGAKRRVKQKALANIVANNLKRVDPKPILKKTTPKSNKNESKALLKKANENKKLKGKNVGFSDKQNDDDASKPLISFTKPTKENSIKTILARKRKSDVAEPKKSLSSIFKSSNSTNTNLLKNSLGTDNSNDKFLNKKAKVESSENKSEVNDSKEVQLLQNNIDTNKSDNRFINKNKKTESFGNKFNKQNTVSFDKDSRPNRNIKKDKFDRNKDSKKEFKEGHVHRGKISSLFGNNPTVPNIGQRFVKPVNEKVFSAEKFSELGIHAYAVSNLEQNMSITTMTTVQKKAIPVILSGSDVLVRSQTGSGKTLTYGIPIIEKLQSIKPNLQRSDGLKALIVVPTRELALQTYECFLKLIKPFTWIVPGYLVGGEKRKAEKARLRKGVTVLVATPGRLLDHIKHTEVLKLDGVKYFVLDEADRMLDMGYEQDISGIVDALEDKVDDSGYNALQMLKQHIRPNTENQDKNNEDANDMENSDEDHSNNEKITLAKKQYHSDTEEESDNESDPKQDKSVKISTEQKDKTEDEKNLDNNKPSKRQTILLSATLTHAVEKLAGLTMHNPVFIDAAKDNIQSAGGNMSEVNEDLVVPQSVSQTYIVTPPKLRMVTLSAYISGRCQKQGSHKFLVFMATQDMIDFHANILSSILGKPIDEEDEDSDPLVDVEFFKLHGSMTQKERTEVFKTFRQAKTGVLLCTDVASRGLDLPKVDTVVQYTGPTSLRDYVHRIGRTARAGSTGTATIFLTPPEVEFVRLLEARRIRIQQEDMDDVLSNLMGPLSPHNSVQAAAVALQNDFENLIIENKKYYTMACKAYTSWMRFYSSYPREMREVFNRRELHLGHYAKSFALRDPPQKIGGAGKAIREREEAQQPGPKHQNRLSNQRKNDGESRRKEAAGARGNTSLRQQDRRSGLLKKVRMLNVSEYDSGLEPIKKPKK